MSIEDFVFVFFLLLNLPLIITGFITVMIIEWFNFGVRIYKDLSSWIFK